MERRKEKKKERKKEGKKEGRTEAWYLTNGGWIMIFGSFWNLMGDFLQRQHENTHCNENLKLL